MEDQSEETSLSAAGTSESSKNDNLNENASWRTGYSSDEFELNSSSSTSAISQEPKSVYAWDAPPKILPIRSLSTLSVMTAEPIEYDCTMEYDFQSSEENSSATTSVPSSTTDSGNGSAATSKESLPADDSSVSTANPKSSAAEDHQKDYSYHGDAAAVESFIHQIRTLKDPPSFYHEMDLNPGPIDMAPRLSNVPSQYQLREMYEYSALHSSDAMAKFYERAAGKDAFNAEVDENDVAPPTSTLHQIDSEYCTEVE